MVDPLSYFSFQPVLHNWCMLSCLWDDAYKRTIAANGKSSPCGGSGFLLLLSEWSFTICLTPYNRNVLSASLNKIFSSFLPSEARKPAKNLPF